MPKEEWGTKRLCPTTGKRFYDMNRSPIVSPYTGDVVELDSSKTRMIAADAEDAATTKAKASTATDSDDQVLDDEDVEVELDDDLLDDDEEEDNVPLEELADVAAEDDDS
ncbi:TIGR02300 family protein [Tateyamaria sp. SN6-1]|uniref:TIGR02300 family protein n=1 Tax=Tateyamaria sp. SN6-1 TaxID=3092148 RepID=UPI0039F598EC